MLFPPNSSTAWSATSAEYLDSSLASHWWPLSSSSSWLSISWWQPFSYVSRRAEIRRYKPTSNHPSSHWGFPRHISIRRLQELNQVTHRDRSVILSWVNLFASVSFYKGYKGYKCRIQSLSPWEIYFGCLLMFYILATSKVISGWVLTCSGAHSWWLL